MSTQYAVDRSVRPRGFSSETEAKVARILRSAERKRLIRSVRDGLQSLIENGEREWTRRRMAGDGNTPPALLVDVIAIETSFDLLMLELGQK